MKFFDKEKVTQCNLLGKKEIKEFIKNGCDFLNTKEKYKNYQLSNKSSVIVDENKNILFFTYFDKICFNFSLKKHKQIYLDSGALKPLERGADVMIPGILKYLDKQDNFEEGDVLHINIEGHGIYAVGVAKLSLTECKQRGEGVCVDVLNVNNGYLEKIIK